MACLQVLFCSLTNDQRDLYRAYLASEEVQDILNVSFSPLVLPCPCNTAMAASRQRAATRLCQTSWHCLAQLYGRVSTDQALGVTHFHAMFYGMDALLHPNGWQPAAASRPAISRERVQLTAELQKSSAVLRGALRGEALGR